MPSDLQSLTAGLGGIGKSSSKGSMSSGIKMPKVSRRMFRIALRKGGKSGLSGTIPSKGSLKGV